MNENSEALVQGVASGDEQAPQRLLEREPPAGWEHTNQIVFELRDGRKIEAALGPNVIGVSFPDGDGGGDYRLPPELRRVLRPHLLLVLERYDIPGDDRPFWGAAR